MAASFLARRRQTLRATGRRLLDEHRALANAVGRIFLQAATARGETGERIIPNRRSTRDAMVATIYAQILKPYYIGGGEEPFAGTRPLSPYALLLYDGVRDMVRLAAEQQAALVRQIVRDETVLAWLLSPWLRQAQSPVTELVEVRPVQEMSFSSFTQWLDPRGFRLTERIQRVAVEVRSRLARFVDYHVGQGTPAPAMATKVEAFLTTGERGNTTYGNHGSNAPRVLVQHEMNKAGGDTVKAATVISPYVRGAQWLLSSAHTESDECDDYAEGGENGDGVYPLSELPIFPAHPRCLCGLRAASVRNPAAVTAALAAAIGEGTEAAQALRGALDPERMTTEALTGAIQQTMDQVQAAPLPVPAAPPLAPAQPSVQLQYNASQRQLDLVNERIDKGVRRLALKHRTTPAEIEEALDAAFKGLVTGRDLLIQFESANVDRFLADPVFRTQFETATSGGIVDTAYRAEAEYGGLGMPLGLDPRQRPIYGYVNLGAVAQEYGEQYGDISFVLKDGVRARTTTTLGDSLFNFAQGNVAGTPINQPGRASWDGFLDELYNYGRTKDVEALWDNISIRYVEIQVQGGVGLDDVKAVIDKKGKLTLGQRQALESKGISIWDN